MISPAERSLMRKGSPGQKKGNEVLGETGGKEGKLVRL